MSEPIELRPVVRWFAEQMELKLRENDGKGGWHEDDPGSLVQRVQEEASELEDAVDDHPMHDPDPESPAASARCIAEAADAANMAMMVADHFREGGPSRDQGQTLGTELRAPTVYRQGMEDGEDHCTICHAVIDEEDGHTHKQCFEEGKSLGALDENLDCASKLSERIGCEMGYFGEVLERVPPAKRLPGELWPAVAQACELVHEPAESRDLEAIKGLRLTVFIPMPVDPARFTHEHMMRVKLRRATVQVSIDDNGHTCVSDDGVTCGLCQRDMSPGSAHTEVAGV